VTGAAAALTVFSDIDGTKRHETKQCTFRRIGSGFEVRYGENGGETAVRFAERGLADGMRAEIERSGEYSGLMVIETGRTTRCCMHTPQGRLDIIVFGRAVSFRITDSGAEAELCYETSLEGSGSASLIDYRFIVKTTDIE